MKCIEYFHAMYRATIYHILWMTFKFYILNHDYYQKIFEVISETVMRKRSLWVFTSFGGMIYYESRSMVVIYSTGFLAKLLYIFTLKVLSHSILYKLSLHLLFRNKNFANNISRYNFFHWSRKSWKFWKFVCVIVLSVSQVSLSVWQWFVKIIQLKKVIKCDSKVQLKTYTTEKPVISAK